MGDRKERGAPPASGNVSLPFEINKSKTVTAETLESLYHTSERGQQGAFPLGIAAQFHSGPDLLVERGKPICSIAYGEVVAARIGVGTGEHPWGDTGFVLLRHPLEGNKSIFSLFVHLQREPLHPDRAHAGWLRRLLLDGADRGKPKWRVMADAPTWKDEDKGKFSPANVQNDKLLQTGVYEEEDRTGENNDLYVRLKGQWVKVAQDGTAKVKVKELSPWADFDLEAAAKKSQTIAALKDVKVAILDADKKDGKRRWTVEASEPIGLAGEYLGRPLVHWSVFSQAAVFPTGSLPEKEFGAEDEVKLSELDLNEERGDVEHTKKLIEALDPQKKTIGKMPQDIPLPGEVELFYRTPAECWRSRYLAVKGLTEFALDVDKFLQLERYKSHPNEQREEFKKNTQAFLFWKDLAEADEFPQDGKAIFVHPATALRLMAAAKGMHYLSAKFLKLNGSPAAELAFEVEGVQGTTDDKGCASLPSMKWDFLEVKFEQRTVRVPAVHDPALVICVWLPFVEPSGDEPAPDDSEGTPHDQVERPEWLFPAGDPGDTEQADPEETTYDEESNPVPTFHVTSHDGVNPDAMDDEISEDADSGSGTDGSGDDGSRGEPSGDA